MKGTITMSTKEADRISVLERLMNKEIKQKQGAKILQLSVRQIRRLLKKYRRDGVKGLIHKLRGEISNRKIEQVKVEEAIKIIQEKYTDFGPTLSHEKLTEFHGVTFSRETLRKAMIINGLWKGKHRKVLVLHQMRERRSSLGELVQADGSPHDWFEGRRPDCTLLVFVDDATSKLLWLEFAESETTQAYFMAARHYLEKHGKPVTLYVDRHGVFRVNTTRALSAAVEDSNGRTQFGRAMDELRIEVIFANSPQAKGRVEKANQTLQDRLVKEMRLKGINNIHKANLFLPEFIEEYNRKFAVVPASPANMHRPLLPQESLDDILCLKYQRILSKQLTVSYQNKIYQIQTERPAYVMRHAPVTIKDDKGRIAIWYKKESLSYTIFSQQPKSEIIQTKQLKLVVDRFVRNTGINIAVANVPYMPPPNHPWRLYRAI